MNKVLVENRGVNKNIPSTDRKFCIVKKNTVLRAKGHVCIILLSGVTYMRLKLADSFTLSKAQVLHI